jgi:hypothetical protein
MTLGKRLEKGCTQYNMNVKKGATILTIMLSACLSVTITLSVIMKV